MIEAIGTLECASCSCEMKLEERNDGSMLFRCGDCRKTIPYRALEGFLLGKENAEVESALNEEFLERAKDLSQYE